MKNSIRKGLFLFLAAALLCASVSASAAAKFAGFPKGNELYLQWKPFKGDWQYPEVRDEGDRIVIEGASALGFAPRAMQTYRYVSYTSKSSGHTSWQWEPVMETKKGNGLDQIIILKPTEGQLAAHPDDARPLKEYPLDNNPDFDLRINYVKSPLKAITLKYNPRWTIEENGLTFLFWYKDGSRCEVFSGGFYLHHEYKINPEKDELPYGFTSVQYDAEGRLRKAVYIGKKDQARYDYKMVSEDPLYYTVTSVRYDSWDYQYTTGLWRNSETGETTEEAPKGISLKKLPFKVIGKPGTPPEKPAALRTESAPGLVELPQEKAVYDSWPGGVPLPEAPSVSVEDIGDGKSRISIRGLAEWGIRPQTLCPYEWNREGYFSPTGQAGEEGVLTADAPENVPMEIDDYISPSEYGHVWFSEDRTVFQVFLQREETMYQMLFSTPGEGLLQVDYPFPGGKISAEYDAQTGALKYYMVTIPWEGKRLVYIYTCEKWRGAINGIPLLYRVLLFPGESVDGIPEEAWDIYEGKWTKDDLKWMKGNSGEEETEGPEESGPPAYADQCVPLPLIALEPSY